MARGETTCLDTGLNTDLYELTMAAAFWKAGVASRPAVFELFVRSLPKDWGYLVCSGVQGAIDFLESVRFDQEQIEWLSELDAFRDVEPGFFDALADFRFEGEVWAVPEGRAVFAGEPILQVRAPLLQAQVVETALLARINFETLVATKAARVVEAAAGRPVVDFGTRRAHGPMAGLLAARASYVGGLSGTSNLCAGRQYDIPVFGTMAHSFVLAFDSEQEAFEAFAGAFPRGSVLIVDTFDPVEGTKRAASLKWPLSGVRLDGGDLRSLSGEIRRLLDQMGRPGVKILLSGDLDEHSITELVSSGAPVDSFGVGTRLVTGWDAPALGGVYKLVEIGGRAVAKRGGVKATMPGAKQADRVWIEGQAGFDLLGLVEEDVAEQIGSLVGSMQWESEPLLEQIMVGGHRVAEGEGPQVGRGRWVADRERLADSLLSLNRPDHHDVRVSDGLARLVDTVRRRTETELR